MKRALPIILCGLLLTGCADRSSSSGNSAAIEIETAAETAAATTATVTEKATAASETELPGAEETDIGRAVVYWTDKGVSVGMSLQKDYYLSKVIPAEHDASTPAPVAEDFDFDGYDEVYIPANEFSGEYYHLNLGKSGFESWDVMNEVTGSQLADLDDSGEQMFSVFVYDSRKGSTRYYKWENKEPVLVREDESYSRDYYYKDHYAYIGGEKKLSSREYFNADTLVKTDDMPVYFRVNDDSIDVFRDDKIIQNIPDIGLYELTEKWNRYTEENRSSPSLLTSEELIYESDYDSDGYNDFCIPVDFRSIGEDNKYIYFRFDPDEDKYVPWDELNNIGKKLVMYRNEDYIEAEDPGTGLDRYKWENGKLVFQEHIDGVRIHD
ncbi:MAG TPA: hypothetical protein P5191_14260 [Ruminococcus sp.]|nr:hypothetical protein [Ruminococcus sp.]